tara:strand:+ start:540 stop:671 length:132 start_codon:yes stop_codon:yes gene_type:complete
LIFELGIAATISGIITDKSTGEPLYANVMIAENDIGTVSDING